VSGSKENGKVWGNFSMANELSPAQRHRWRLVVNALRGLRGPARVVDLGCGSGVLLEKIGRGLPEAELFGIDVEPSALAMAAQRLPKASLLAMDLDDLVPTPAGWEKMDAVVCSEVLEHLAHPLPALRLARKLLRPGGRVVVTVPSGPMNRFDRSIGHRKHYTGTELADLVREAGFEDVRVSGWGFPFHTLFRVALAAAPQATDQFSDEKIGILHRAVFRTLDLLFYLNIRSGRVGRQLVGIATRR